MITEPCKTTNLVNTRTAHPPTCWPNTFTDSQLVEALYEAAAAADCDMYERTEAAAGYQWLRDLLIRSAERIDTLRGRGRF